MKTLRTIRTEIIINKSKADVWDILFHQFGEVNNFNPLLVGSRFLPGVKSEAGTRRVCDLSDKNSIEEEISAVRGDCSFDVIITKGNLPMMDQLFVTFDVESLGSKKTLVSATMKFNTKPAIMGKIVGAQMLKTIDQVLIGLKYHAETGGLVTKQNFKAIHREYKKLSTEGSLKAVA